MALSVAHKSVTISGGITLKYQEAGDGKPLVMLHGCRKAPPNSNTRSAPWPRTGASSPSTNVVTACRTNPRAATASPDWRLTYVRY